MHCRESTSAGGSSNRRSDRLPHGLFELQAVPSFHCDPDRSRNTQTHELIPASRDADEFTRRISYRGRHQLWDRKKGPCHIGWDDARSRVPRSYWRLLGRYPARTRSKHIPIMRSTVPTSTPSIWRVKKGRRRSPHPRRRGMRDIQATRQRPRGTRSMVRTGEGISRMPGTKHTI